MNKSKHNFRLQAAKILKTVFAVALLVSVSNLQAQPGRNNNNNRGGSCNGPQNGGGGNHGDGGNHGGGNHGGGGNSNCMPVVSASFSADDLSVTATSTKDLSNVVLEFCDETTQKFNCVNGKSKTFSGTGSNAGKLIQGVWIKSGCNSSNDGPGYGEYVPNPDEFVCNPVAPSCFAWEIVSYSPGKRYDDSDLTAERSIPERALGDPQKSDAVTSEADVNFVALGFGGELVIKFQYPIQNGPGADVKVWETTYPNNTGNCAAYPETINAFASQDGCNWEFIGGGCQDTELDLGVLSWAQFIKLIDVSPKAAFAAVGHIADGYDVDGIECLNGAAENPELESTDCKFAVALIAFDQKLRKDGQPVLAPRSDGNNALGEPERVDAGVNFASLGFGGSIILGFNCVIFDKPGDDIEIAETSFGTPACSVYPEKALVEGSLDLVSWEVLAAEICQDAFIDLAGRGPIKYLKITDISDASKFANSVETDGYDVDGVVVLQPGCSAAPRMAEKMTPAIAGTKIYPNPVSNQLSVSFNTGDVQESISVRIFNAMGQVVVAENFTAERSAEINKNINLSSVANGVYFISVERNDVRETFQIVKQ